MSSGFIFFSAAVLFNFRNVGNKIGVVGSGEAGGKDEEIIFHRLVRIILFRKGQKNDWKKFFF